MCFENETTAECDAYRVALLKPRPVTAPRGHSSEAEEFLTTGLDAIANRTPSEIAIVHSEFFTSFRDLDFLIMLLELRVDI